MSSRTNFLKIIYHFPHTYFDEQLPNFLELVTETHDSMTKQSQKLVKLFWRSFVIDPVTRDYNNYILEIRLNYLFKFLVVETTLQLRSNYWPGVL